MEVLCAPEFQRDLAQKYVDGAEFMDDEFRPLGNPYFTGPRDFYIEKPKTITVTFEIPRPLSISEYLSALTYYACVGNKVINFSSNADREAFPESLLKAIEEAMRE